MQIKARLVDPPVDARIPQITYSKINDARAKTWEGKVSETSLPHYIANELTRNNIKRWDQQKKRRCIVYGYFWITSPLTMV